MLQSFLFLIGTFSFITGTAMFCTGLIIKAINTSNLQLTFTNIDQHLDIEKQADRNHNSSMQEIQEIYLNQKLLKKDQKSIKEAQLEIDKKLHQIIELLKAPNVP